jgi:hypothetical protein
MLVLRVGQTVLERAVVSEEEQAFAVLIEAAYGVDVRDGYVVAQGRPSGAAELRHDTVRFMEQNIAVAHFSGSAKA